MLRAEPKSWFSWDYTVYDNGAPVADLDLAWVREAGEVIIEGVACTLYRESLLSGAFILEAGGFPLARAEKPSVLFRTFEIAYDDRHHYTLQARSAFARTFVLCEGDREIGSIYPDHIFSRKMTVDLPEALPLAVRVFITWLVILMWKRAAQSSS